VNKYRFIFLLVTFGIFCIAFVYYYSSDNRNKLPISISAISKKIATKTTKHFDTLKYINLKPIKCRFSSKYIENNIFTDDIEKCLTDKFRHDLKFTEIGQLDLLFLHNGKNIIGNIKWSHPRLLNLRESDLLHKLKYLLSIPKWHNYLSTCLNNNIEINFEQPIKPLIYSQNISTIKVMTKVKNSDNNLYALIVFPNEKEIYTLNFKSNATCKQILFNDLSNHSFFRHFFEYQPIHTIGNSKIYTHDEYKAESRSNNFIDLIIN